MDADSDDSDPNRNTVKSAASRYRDGPVHS